MIGKADIVTKDIVARLTSSKCAMESILRHLSAVIMLLWRPIARTELGNSTTVPKMGQGTQ